MGRVSELGLSGGPLLHGSDVKKLGKDAVAVVIDRVRPAPRNFGAPLIIEFDSEPVPGISQWACNQTETARIASRISDEWEEWRGWGLILEVIMQNNPTIGKLVPGLVVAEVVTPESVLMRRNGKVPAKKAAKDAKQPKKEKIDYSKVPF